mmetsp:Transcript_85551/g.277055  ORF Transcript_85551/g.277055 Transcript_85551/m.277055 type:complete len:225 (-) Transcript_85551:111-785(-)
MRWSAVRPLLMRKHAKAGLAGATPIASKASKARWSLSKLPPGSSSSHSQRTLGSASRWSGLSATKAPCRSSCWKSTFWSRVMAAVRCSCSCRSSHDRCSAANTLQLKVLMTLRRLSSTARRVPAFSSRTCTAFSSAVSLCSRHWQSVSTRRSASCSARPGFRTPSRSSQRAQERLASSRLGFMLSATRARLSTEAALVGQSSCGTRALGSHPSTSRICRAFLPG